MNIDTTSEFGARAERRLQSEEVGWLTTVAADGTPQPSPVWFIWDGASIVVYSRPNTPKLRHITANPRVSLHLNGDATGGGNIVIITGSARIDTNASPAHADPAYVAKYAPGLARLGMTAEQFAAAYSVALRLMPEKLRGH